MHLTMFASAFVLAFSSLSVSADSNWTRFRGPNGTGISKAKNIPITWTNADYDWRIKLPGTGHSSPVVWGERLFVMCTNEQNADRMLLCFNASNGREIWKKIYKTERHHHHKYNSFASSSPTVDANRVYFVWASPESLAVVALDHDGKEVWKRDLGVFKSQHGYGASPIIYKDRLIVTNDQWGDSSVHALGLATGETKWVCKRKAGDRGGTAYGAPTVFKPARGSDQLILSSRALGISSIDPDTGKLNWDTAGIYDKRSVSSPVVASGHLIGACGSGGGGNYLVAFKPDSTGANPKEAWRIKRSSPYVPTSLAHGDLVFLFYDGGIVTCVHTPTGEVKWGERIQGATFFGSPILIGGRLYCISKEGDVIVLAAAEKFELLGRTALGEKSYATPAVANGRLYLRTYGQLMCVGGAK